ncbi:MAG TPA: HlyD family efflux transporter periplasmic adaptor subunit [Pyrinomonadaceae bacterium]|jgi:HlyD family secretion protein|nr:HlyD family efflux transporter periplasmic adaptor subunit [Pyrinomonadaceae bacterium]
MVDIKRTGKSKLKKRIRSAVLIVVGLAAIGGITFGLSRLERAAPTLDRSTAVIDTVKRGPFVREVRGIGTLVPQLVRYIPAPADGRVEKIPVQAGVTVGFDTVIAELSNPKMEQEAMDADFQVKAAEADAESLRTRLESESMTQQSTIASINSEYSRAKLQLDTDEVLGKQQLVPELLLKISRMNVLDLSNRLKVEQQRLAVNSRSVKAQVNAQQSRISQLRALAKLKRDQATGLKVRAGTSGVLQEISVQVGQQVAPGANIARVADPASLKAELKIAETQIKDVRLGQVVAVDTRNGIIQGEVQRIDPAAREGTFVVDVALTGPLPASARPDLSVDGTIELERLADVLHVGRPAFGQGQQTVGLFRLSPDGQQADRTQVTLGRSSVSTIEIVSGLKEGDQVILSDTSALDSYNRIRVR